MSEKWEDVESPNEGDYLERIKVSGGWLYRCIYFHEDSASMAMVFVKDVRDDS